MKTIISMLCLSATALAGCAFLQHQKIYPFPAEEVTVVENKIYCGGKPFAKLMTLQPGEHDLNPESAVFPGVGLVIYYYENSKEVWIHPQKGISLHRENKEYTKIEDLQREWAKGRPTIRIGSRIMDKEDFVRSVVFDVKISNDGKFISYKTQGMLWNSSDKYHVEYGY